MVFATSDRKVLIETKRMIPEPIQNAMDDGSNLQNLTRNSVRTPLLLAPPSSNLV
jgi:hypothetical protein